MAVSHDYLRGDFLMKNKSMVIFSVVALILLFVGGGYFYKNN